MSDNVKHPCEHEMEDGSFCGIAALMYTVTQYHKPRCALHRDEAGPPDTSRDNAPNTLTDRSRVDPKIEWPKP